MVLKNSKSHLLAYKELCNPQPESTSRLFLHEVNEILVPCTLGAMCNPLTCSALFCQYLCCIILVLRNLWEYLPLTLHIFRDYRVNPRTSSTYSWILILQWSVCFLLYTLSFLQHRIGVPDISSLKMDTKPCSHMTPWCRKVLPFNHKLSIISVEWFG